MYIDMIFILMRSLLVIVGVESFTGQQMETETSNYAIIRTANKTREIGNGTLTKPYWKENDDQVAKLITKVKYKPSTTQPTNVATSTPKITTTALPKINSYNSYKQHLPFDLNEKLKFIIEPLSFYKPGVVSDALSKADNKQYTRTHIQNDFKINKLPDNIYSNNTRINSTRSMKRPENRNLLNHLNYGKTNSSDNATRRDLLTTESNDSPLSYIPVYSYSNHIYHQMDQKQTQQFEQSQPSSLDYIDFLQHQRRERRPRSAFYDYFISNYDNKNNMDDEIADTDDEDNDEDNEEAEQIRSWSDVFINYKNPHHVNFGHIEHRPRLFETRFQTIKDGNRFKGEVIWSNDKSGYGEHYWDLAVGKL